MESTQLTQLPQVNAPLPWHQSQWQQLGEQFAQGRFPHALLLAGEAGTGIAELAMAFSRLLLCAAPHAGLNCGECHACVLSATGAHGDFLWIEPQEKSRTIKIDQVREAVQFTTKTAGFGLRKVIVLSPADAMNTNAFNALLKSLEEPAAETYLLLVCNALHNVPPTIRSRCQLQRLAVPDREESLKWLDNITGKRPLSEDLLSLAEGRPLQAQQLFLADTADQVRARRAALQALQQGKISAADAAVLWSDVETSDFLQQLREELQRVLSTLTSEQLQSEAGRGAFRLLDEMGGISRAVSAGSNPGKAMLVDAMLAKFQRELGNVQLGDNMPHNNKGLSP